MSGRDIDSVFALVAEVRFAFQPVVNIKTGAVVAVEALARPAGSHVQDLFRQAARQRRLTELDIELAIAALDSAAEHETILPLHLNVFGGTITHDLGRFDLLREKLQETGRQEHDITLEIGPPFARLDPAQLIAGTEKLRGTGFRIALDGVGDGDVPLTLVSNLQANMIKLDRTVVSGLPEDGGRMALVEAVRHICESTESQLVAEGVENERQLNALRRNGVRLVQGNLLAPANRRPPKKLVIPGVAAEITEPQAAPVSTLATGPRVTEFLSPATTLPHDVTAEKVREVLADHPEVNGVVLVDSRNRPQWTIDRNRFLLAVTGPYGHALHAHRPASRLADEPRVVTTATTAMEALSLITSSDQSRMYDDAVVVDETGRCLGAVRAGDLIRGMAELKVEEAAALNPLTRLPGSDAIARDVTRRISAGDVFAVSWLDVDKFKKVNDTAGFSAGDDLIRSVGRSLTDAAAKLRSVQVGHVGGDDFLVVAAPEELDRLVEMVLDQPRSVADIPVSLSLATLVCAQNAISSYDEASRRLAPLKKQAKDLTGASWVMAWAGNDKIEVLRGRPAGPPQPPTPGGLLPPTDSTPPPPHDG
ncbi:GGDEF domain-containing protein [Saccharopolyspora rectivirgula]|uniref:GGDEF domain-containing protein n=1 Tax=Saccharopolyspora rectivirgula TaxID=28042 RepID=UPI000688FBD7|nr:GGDEF domain-containing protein [Saccharopolyspora rectivirgula]